MCAANCRVRHSFISYSHYLRELKTNRGWEHSHQHQRTIGGLRALGGVSAMNDHPKAAGEFVGRIERLLVVTAVCVLLLSQFTSSYAAGPFDGEWTGSATPNRGRCRPAPVTLTVAGKVVTGEVRLERETEIRGTVWEDGSFGATIGFNQLTGQFSRDTFEGAFETSDCTWKMLLKRKPGP